MLRRPKKLTRKIGFFGLDAAGKTSFLSVLSKTYSLGIDPKPTKGIERSKKDIIGQQINLFDYGGQSVYRDRYLQSDKDLTGFDLVYYIVDIQDKDRFAESEEYLTNLLEKMDDFNQNNLIICFHKNDPDLKDQIKDQLSEIWRKMDNKVEDAYAFIPTSIMDEKSIIRAFSMGLRKIATKKEMIEQQLTQFSKDVGTSGVVILNTDGFVVASKVLDEQLTEKVENVGISLTNALLTNDVKFEQVTGKTDIGEFRIDNTSINGNDYYTFVIGTKEQYNLEKMKSIIQSLTLA